MTLTNDYDFDFGLAFDSLKPETNIALRIEISAMSRIFARILHFPKLRQLAKSWWLNRIARTRNLKLET